jgi:sugar/nucleoside kinase (ribokinase family)
MLAGGTAPEAVLYAVKTAKEQGLLVSFDLNYRALQWKSPEDCRDQVVTILPYVDFLKISNEESFLFGGDGELSRVMEQYDIPLLVLTRGPGPSSVFWNGREWRRPSVRKNAVDTTGAGDAFWGTFLYTLLSEGVQKREDLSEACIAASLRYGVAAGELAILKPGAIPSLPLRAEVEEALALYE